MLTLTSSIVLLNGHGIRMMLGVLFNDLVVHVIKDDLSGEEWGYEKTAN